MARFTEILRDRNFFFLWLGQIIAQFGDRLNQMALIAFVYSRSPGSTWAMAKLMSFTILPVFLIGPVAGAYVDRWNRRRTMFICDFLRGIFVFSIPFFLLNKEPLIPIYLLVFLSFCVGRFFVPAKMSIIPELVDKNSLLIANSLVTTTGMIAAILGFGIGGILVSPNVLGVSGGFYLNAITFFISAVFIFSISPRFSLGISKESISKVSKDIAEVIQKSVISEIKDGLVYLVQQKRVRYVLGMLFLLWSALGAVYVVSIVFVQEALHTVTKDLGLLVIFLGAGLFIGSLLYGRFGTKFSHARIMFSFLGLSGIVLISFATLVSLSGLFLVAAILSFVLGLCVSPIMIAANTLIHEVSDNSMLGRVFSSLEFVMHLAFLLFMFLSSFLAEFMPSLWILVGAGVIISISGLIGFIKNK